MKVYVLARSSSMPGGCTQKCAVDTAAVSDGSVERSASGVAPLMRFSSTVSTAPRRAMVDVSDPASGSAALSCASSSGTYTGGAKPDLEAPSSYRDLSKPIGALDEARLRHLRERCASLEPGDRFLYGTHYSAPAFVAFFLLRQAPELTLHLHGGRFDEADRQFFSIAEAWSSAISSTTDVKEASGRRRARRRRRGLARHTALAAGMREASSRGAAVRAT